MRNSFWLILIQFHSLWPIYSNIGSIRLLQLYKQNQWCCRTWNAIISLVLSHVEIKSLITLSCLKFPLMPVERERHLERYVQSKGAFHLRLIWVIQSLGWLREDFSTHYERGLLVQTIWTTSRYYKWLIFFTMNPASFVLKFVCSLSLRN